MFFVSYLQYNMMLMSLLFCSLEILSAFRYTPSVLGTLLVDQHHKPIQEYIQLLHLLQKTNTLRNFFFHRTSFPPKYFFPLIPVRSTGARSSINFALLSSTILWFRILGGKRTL